MLAVRTEPADIKDERVLSRPVTLERILVPVDFSDCSLDALEYAVVVAQQAKASLMFLHVLEPVSYGLDFTLSHIRTREHVHESWTKRLKELTSSTSILMWRWNFSFGAAFQLIQSSILPKPYPATSSSWAHTGAAGSHTPFPVAWQRRCCENLTVLSSRCVAQSLDQTIAG